MHDAQVRTLERDRQAAQELDQRGELAQPRLARCIEEPVRTVLAHAAQHVELVIAEHRLCEPAAMQSCDQAEHARAVGPAVAEIADEHQPPALRVLPRGS
ncbi:MAG: hypothetical protein U1F11_00880 [Steroidobacteraceae bacterium]